MTSRVLLLVYHQQIATSHLREGMLERNCFNLRLLAANVEMFLFFILFLRPCVLWELMPYHWFAGHSSREYGCSFPRQWHSSLCYCKHSQWCAGLFWSSRNGHRWSCLAHRWPFRNFCSQGVNISVILGVISLEGHVHCHVILLLWCSHQNSFLLLQDVCVCPYQQALPPQAHYEDSVI